MLLEQARPGPEHALFEDLEGDWSVTFAAAGADPGAPNGTARSERILGGRFLRIEYASEVGGEQVEGLYVLGYDRRNARFELTSFDTAGTYVLVSRGTAEDGGRLKLYGQDDDPFMASLGFEKEFAHALDLGDPDDRTLEILYIDTRTPDRAELPASVLRFERAG
jgi:hypothetical protein